MVKGVDDADLALAKTSITPQDPMFLKLVVLFKSVN